MDSKLNLRNFDFATTMLLLAVWGASMVWPLRHGVASIPWTFPGYAMLAWVGVSAWWRWRRPGEDERVRHIILMSSYISRQVTLVAALVLLLVSESHPLGPVAWPVAITGLLLFSDLAARRYLGLRDEELNAGRPAWHASLGRVLFASAAGFLLVAVLAIRFIYMRHP